MSNTFITNGNISVAIASFASLGGGSLSVNSVKLAYTYTYTTPINWYANAMGGLALDTGASYNITDTAQLHNPGVYTYYAEANNGNCVSARTPVTLTVNALPQVSVAATPVSCNGSANGQAVATVTGATGIPTYSWNTIPTQTTDTATGLAVGTYAVTIINTSGCSITDSVTITQPPALTATNSQTNVSCNGNADGDATIAVSGGTTPYTYVWDDGQTAATATSLPAEINAVTVTDAHGCSFNQPFTIMQPDAIIAAGSQTNVSCNGSTDGNRSIVRYGYGDRY